MEKIDKLLRSGNVDDVRIAFELMMEHMSIEDIEKLIPHHSDYPGIKGLDFGFFFKIGERRYITCTSYSIWLSHLYLEEKYNIGEYLGPHKELR